MLWIAVFRTWASKVGFYCMGDRIRGPIRDLYIHSVVPGTCHLFFSCTLVFVIYLVGHISAVFYGFSSNKVLCCKELCNRITAVLSFSVRFPILGNFLWVVLWFWRFFFKHIGESQKHIAAFSTSDSSLYTILIFLIQVLFFALGKASFFLI